MTEAEIGIGQLAEAWKLFTRTVLSTFKLAETQVVVLPWGSAAATMLEGAVITSRICASCEIPPAPAKTTDTLPV
jgi:uracil DNA glycosylase